jgi:hypothetical protein
LRVCHMERSWPEHAEKGLWRHRARAYLHIVRLLQHAATGRPEGLQVEKEFLKGQCLCVRHTPILNDALLRSAWPDGRVYCGYLPCACCLS